MADSTIYARVDPSDKEALRSRVREEPSWTETTVIRQLIKHFLSLNEDDQKALMLGTGQNPLARTGSLLHRLGWLDHALMRELWPWALEEAYDLLNQAEQDRAVDLCRFVHFRCGHCWGRFALQLRDEAHNAVDRWNEYYSAADWALCASITHYKEYSDGGAEISHPLVAYNVACRLSRRAQFEIERVHGPKAEPTGASERTAAIKDRDWRSEIGDEQFTEVQMNVVRYFTAAIDLLGEIASYEDGPSDRQFIFRHAQRDPDLEFLRAAPAFRETFQAWLTRNNNGSLDKTLSKLKERVPAPLLERIEAARGRARSSAQ